MEGVFSILGYWIAFTILLQLICLALLVTVLHGQCIQAHQMPNLHLTLECPESMSAPKLIASPKQSPDPESSDTEGSVNDCDIDRCSKVAPIVEKKFSKSKEAVASIAESSIPAS